VNAYLDEQAVKKWIETNVSEHTVPLKLKEAMSLVGPIAAELET
jgi:hypothetical protein